MRSTAAALDQEASTPLEVRSPVVAGRSLVVPAAHSLPTGVERNLAVVEGCTLGVAGRTFVVGDIPPSPLH